MEELEAYLLESIGDEYFSRSEKRSLKSLIAAHKLNTHQLNVLRSKIYDLANERINGENYSFIMQWVEESNKALVVKPKVIQSSVYFSPGESCRRAIIEEIRKTSGKLSVCVFTISDDIITRELIACHKKGVSVKIITDNDKLFDKGSDIDELAESGIPVKIDYTSNHMHHKFMIRDQDSLLTGSYNWTRSAASYNHENILLTEEQSAVRSYLKEFDQLWNEMEGL